MNALKQEARVALEQSNFSQAESLLLKARVHDLQAIEQQRQALTMRQRSAAATNAELGTLKRTQLAYTAAACR